LVYGRHQTSRSEVEFAELVVKHEMPAKARVEKW
jgi:hypothetical protein